MASNLVGDTDFQELRGRNEWGRALLKGLQKNTRGRPASGAQEDKDPEK